MIAWWLLVSVVVLWGCNRLRSRSNPDHVSDEWVRDRIRRDGHS